MIKNLESNLILVNRISEPSQSDLRLILKLTWINLNVKYTFINILWIINWIFRQFSSLRCFLLNNPSCVFFIRGCLLQKSFLLLHPQWVDVHFLFKLNRYTSSNTHFFYISSFEGSVFWRLNYNWFWWNLHVNLKCIVACQRSLPVIITNNNLNNVCSLP